MSTFDINHIEGYRTSLSRLMPSGFAWSKDKGSAQYAWLTAKAIEFNDFEQYTYRTVEQFYPHSTCNRFAEWKRAVGLPDACFAESSEISLRTQMLTRLRGLSGLAYDDSSPAAPESIKSMCAVIGYDVDVWYSTPFRVGRDAVGDHLGALDGVLNVQINRVCEPFRAGANRVGDRLEMCTQTGLELVCYLTRIVPARFTINTIF
ncbi:hypothetical protein DTO96_102144 [Ephemeroptericola cinctiostellae]|uniref:Uncharacterized protein n=1 Tax=Ephemeroptericola cinctiostellae TaxID=2268024 RepID=A0A345DDF2_9BURK|nr:putative phage tail protein [Ephemeroptericola cinctiostellae]AXF86390.1 hypothetical protein DTO96_102144 [Ephemeroptericola cinctiostellae]